MRVLKFGGTSVGSPERMRQVAEIIAGVPGTKIVVLSAVSGTTNTLVSISDHCSADEKTKARKVAADLHKKYHDFVAQLFPESSYHKGAVKFVDQIFNNIDQLIAQNFSEQVAKMLLAQGEIISTRFFTDYLTMTGHSCSMMMAQDYMTLDEYAEPDLKTTRKKIQNKITY